MVLLILALLMALVMGISLTSISEAGVSNTYSNHTKAFQAAEAGLNHSLALVRNFTNTADGGDPNFTKLLQKRVSPPPTAPGALSTNYLIGNNPFTDSASADFASGSEMISDAIDSGGNVLLNYAGYPLGHQFIDASGNPVPGAYYSVHVIDDERSSSAAVVKVPNFSPSVSWEDGDAALDTNNRIVVYSTGTYGNASVTLEGWIGFLPYPALVAQQDITIWGNSVIQGAYGGVHSNNDLTVGASASIEQTATAVGTFTQTGSSDIGGFHAGGQPAMYIPKFVTRAPLTSGGPASNPRIQDYVLQKADTILIDPGYRNDRPGETGLQRSDALAARLNVDATQLWAAINSTNQENAITITRGCPTCLGTPTVVTTVGDTGWKYNGGNGWDTQGSQVDNHTFYVVGLDNYSSNPNGGNVKITTNLGTDTNPIHITVLATGSIEVDGTPNMVANLTGLATPELPPFVTINSLFMAVEDVKIRGDAAVPHFSGIIYAGEQFDLSGNGSFDGQIISLGDPDITSSLVSANSVSGSFELTFNGGQAVGNVKLMSWRQIKGQ
jgi:hypothetical protein